MELGSSNYVNEQAACGVVATEQQWKGAIHVAVPQALFSQ